ncbi:MAG: hypothetical protein HGJ94_05365 [Desulfosarcina sp.]|nr:hypothetical protein [Desulfosarcina sp.]MBC2742623.1 hypothetical protein [Desulfosarcina sp.]MBC2765533.1 hypothetical protein [Desulfosarcina sp.]
METTGHPRPGKTETRLSAVILAILVMIGAGVYLRQSHINPAVVALRPEAHRHALPPDLYQAALIDTKGSRIAPFSPPERFDPDTLYEKINGRADLYLSSGFVSLNTQRFTMDETAGNWMELFVYDMATPENAFSVFSMQRREGARTDDIVPNAYRTENALFMTHGNVYLEIIGTDASEDLQQAMGLLAQVFVQTHGGTTAARVLGADLFPEDGLAPESLQLITANAFGYEQLNQIYTCEYNIDGTRLTAFVSERQNTEDASVLSVEYQQTLLSYGATVVDSSVSVDSATVMHFFDTYEIVFSRGRYLAGVHEAGSLEAAKILARRLAGHLEVSDGK